MTDALGISDPIKWHDWAGGARDIAAGVPVAVRWRDGSEWQGDAADFQWVWAPEPHPQDFDIVAYAILPTPKPDLSDNKIWVPN